MHPMVIEWLATAETAMAIQTLATVSSGMGAMDMHDEATVTRVTPIADTDTRDTAIRAMVTWATGTGLLVMASVATAMVDCRFQHHISRSDSAIKAVEGLAGSRPMPLTACVA